MDGEEFHLADAPLSSLGLPIAGRSIREVLDELAHRVLQKVCDVDLSPAR